MFTRVYKDWVSKYNMTKELNQDIADFTHEMKRLFIVFETRLQKIIKKDLKDEM